MTTSKRASKAKGYCVLVSGLAWFCCVPVATIEAVSPPAGASAATSRPAMRQEASPARASQPSSTGDSPATDDNRAALRNLIEQVAAHEALLRNVRVTGTSKAEKKMSADGAWEPLSSATVTDIYINEPGGKFRDERDSTTPWINGAAPFYHEVAVTAFDGQSRRVLTPDRKRGVVEADRGYCDGTNASGWRYSLYGAMMESGMPVRLSRYLDDFAGRKEARIVVSRVAQGDSFYWQATIYLRDRKLESWSFDPNHGYAIRQYEQYEQGKVARLFTVNKLAEAAPGVFYPADVTTSEIWPSNIRAVMASLGRETRSHVQVSSVAANIPDLSDDVFCIKWPEGTPVEDKVAGTTFVVRKGQ